MRRRWHPILATREPSPGVWELVSDGDVYGTVTIVRRGPEVGYRGELRGNVVGYYRTLNGAIEAVHDGFIRSHSRAGGINGT